MSCIAVIHRKSTIMALNKNAAAPEYTRGERIAIRTMWFVGPLAVAGVAFLALGVSGQLPWQ
jgi:hypothetical protein